MRLISVKNTVVVVVGKNRIPLVTLDSPQQAFRALRWTRRFETAVEGASALLTYCRGKGLKPKGRVIAEKRCSELAGLRTDYR